MKRSEIKLRPLADTVLATLEPDAKEYRELDGGGLYLRVKPDGNKSWHFRYKNATGKWSWLGLGGYPDISGALGRKKAAEHREDISHGIDPLQSYIPTCPRMQRKPLETGPRAGFLLLDGAICTRINLASLFPGLHPRKIT